MKKIILLLQIIFTTSITCQSQIFKIKKEVSELFYDLTIPATKYDARKLLHSSNNFSEIDELSFKDDDLIIAKFKENFKLSFLSNATKKSLQFSFKKGTDQNTGWVLNLYYTKEFAKSCFDQFRELINYYKPISTNSNTTPIIIENTKIGDMFYAYSSAKSSQKKDGYIIITTEFEEIKGKVIDLPPNVYYTITIRFYPSFLY